MTASDVLNEFRPMVSDASSIRWTDPAAILLLCNVLDEIWVRRRSAFNLTSIPLTMPAKPSVVGSTVYVQDSYRLPMAHYMAFLALMEDSDDAANAKLATMHYDLYEKGMG